jgi:hypothetical protein
LMFRHFAFNSSQVSIQRRLRVSIKIVLPLYRSLRLRWVQSRIGAPLQ